MEMQTFYQISLIAAFVAGMVALFAPCCISYLLPAYLGNIFKEKKQILLMTLVYSLGIFVVMIPVVLGAKVLSDLFFRWHDQTYIVGGVFMLIVSVIALLGMKLPMPHFALRQKNGHDITSTFVLGVISGITSACCAPVLVGVVTLSSLSPSLLQALGVGAAYVLGMVTPLYFAAALIHKRNILEKPILKKKLSEVTLFNKTYPILVSNVVAFVIFSLTGTLLLVLTPTGLVGMPTADSPVTQMINDVAVQVTGITNQFPAINLIFLLVIALLIARLVQEIRQRTPDTQDNQEETGNCCVKDQNQK